MKYTFNQSQNQKTVKLHRSSNRRHERCYFTVEGNKRAASCKNKMEQEVTRWKKKCQDLLSFRNNRWVCRLANKNIRAKTDRDVSLLKSLFQRKIELRNVQQNTSCSTQLFADRVRVRCGVWHLQTADYRLQITDCKQWTSNRCS